MIQIDWGTRFRLDNWNRLTKNIHKKGKMIYMNIITPKAAGSIKARQSRKNLK